MLSVQSRLREIAAAKVRVFAGLVPEPELPPVKNRVVMQLPLRDGSILRDGLPAYLFADMLLQLPPDTKIIGLQTEDYNQGMGLCLESSEFPEEGPKGCYRPLYLEITADTKWIPREGGEEMWRRITSLKTRI